MTIDKLILNFWLSRYLLRCLDLIQLTPFISSWTRDYAKSIIYYAYSMKLYSNAGSSKFYALGG